MNKLKRVLALILSLAMVIGLISVPTFAAESDHAARVYLTSTSVGEKAALKVEMQVKTGATAIKGFASCIAFDNTLFDLIKPDGTVISLKETKQVFKKDSGAYTPNTNFTIVNQMSAALTGSVGIVGIQNVNMTADQIYADYTACGTFYLAFKSGKSVSDVMDSSVRWATYAEATSVTFSNYIALSESSDTYSVGNSDSTKDSAVLAAASAIVPSNFTFATPHTHNPSSEWSYDSNHHWHVCNGAGDCDQDNKLDYAKHNYDKMIVGSDHLAAAATCTARASYYYSCECGANDLTQTFEYGDVATTHQLTHHDRVAPTCTTLGKIEYWSCDVCSKNFEDSTGTTLATNLDIAVDSTNHNVELTHNPRMEPNCHEVGRLEFWYCPNCHENFTNAAGTVKAPSDLTLSSDSSNHTGPYVYQDNPSEPAAKHDKVCQGCNTTVATEPHNNAGANGSCSVCGHGCAHVNVTHHDAKSHTCTDAGTIEYWSCNVCGQKFSDVAKTQQITDITNPEDPAAHSLGKTDRVEPPCTTDGNIEYYTCSVCKNKFSDNAGTVKVDNVTIPALDHDMAPATCTKPAHCKRTGCTYTEGVALNHNFKYVDRPNQDGFIKYADLKCTNEGCTVAAKDVDAMKSEAVQATLNLDVFLQCTKAADSGNFTGSGVPFFYQVIKGENDIATVGFPLFTGDFSHRLNQQYTLVSGKGTNDNDALFNMRLPQREGDAWTVKMAQPDSALTGWTIDDTVYRVYFTIVNDVLTPVYEKRVEKQIEQDPTTDAGASADPTEPVPPTDPVYEFEAVNEIVFNNIFKVEKKDDPTPPTPTPVIPDGPKHTNRRYPAKPAASTDTKKPDGVTSARTFDAGVALYVGMSVLSLTGTALVIGKKKEF